MTGHQIDNFVGSLVEMAKAFEERPKLEQQINDQLNMIDTLNRANSDLRDSNDLLRGHIETLTAKVAEVTKERDDAGFRCLEADDKAARVLDLARTLASGLGQVIAEVEPPKPQEPVVEQPKAELDPVNKPEDRHPMFPEEGYYTPPATGQSDPSPTQPPSSDYTTHSDHGQPASGSETVSQSSTTDKSESGETAEANSSNDKPYAGKRYTELPAWDRPRDFTTWEAGGGDWQGWVS